MWRLHLFVFRSKKEKALETPMGDGSSSYSSLKVLVKLVELLRVQPAVGHCPSHPVCLFYFRRCLALASR